AKVRVQASGWPERVRLWLRVGKERTQEGIGIGQAALREVQGDQAAWRGDGYLLRSQAQEEAGIREEKGPGRWRVSPAWISRAKSRCGSRSRTSMALAGRRRSRCWSAPRC